MGVTPEEIAEALVKVQGRPNYWIVTFGRGAAAYQLAYADRPVAETIAQCLRQLVIEGIKESGAVGDLVPLVLQVCPVCNGTGKELR